MLATNLYDNRQHEVYQYKSLLYSKTSSKALPYRIYEETNESESEIEYGFRYTYFNIEGKLYDSFLTNDYKVFAKEFTQMRLDL